MIEQYSFGKMTINGRTYTSDIIIFPDRVDDSWWRKSGHFLVSADIQTVFEAGPEVIVIGTGFYGLLRVGKEVRERAEAEHIILTAEKTKKAVDSFNRYYPQKKTVGAFHLTC